MPDSFQIFEHPCKTVSDFFWLFIHPCSRVFSTSRFTPLPLSSKGMNVTNRQMIDDDVYHSLIFALKNALDDADDAGG